MKNLRVLFFAVLLFSFSKEVLFANAIDAALADVDYMVQDQIRRDQAESNEKNYSETEESENQK